MKNGATRVARWLMLSLVAAIAMLLLVACSTTSAGTDEPDPGVLLPLADEDGMMGYVDTTGSWVIEPQYESALTFEAGLAPVLTEDGSWGYIDDQNDLVIEAQFEVAWVHTAEEGLARVMIDGLWGYIDTTGAFAIEPQFTDASGFCEGVAAVQGAGEGEGIGYIDTTGAWVLQPTLSNAGSMCQGLAPFYDRDSGLVGYMDIEGTPVIEPQYEEGYEFSEDGLALIARDGLFGYIDTTGEVVIEPQFAWALTFSRGLAPARRPGAQVGYIDASGEWAIDPQFEDAGVFFTDYAPATDGEREFWITTDGLIISPG